MRRPELDVHFRILEPRLTERDVQPFRELLRGRRHELHESCRPDCGFRVRNERAFLQDQPHDEIGIESVARGVFLDRVDVFDRVVHLEEVDRRGVLLDRRDLRERPFDRALHEHRVSGAVVQLRKQRLSIAIVELILVTLDLCASVAEVRERGQLVREPVRT